MDPDMLNTGFPMLPSMPEPIQIVTGAGVPFLNIADNNGMMTVHFGPDFQTAIQKEIREYLKRNIELEIFHWKEDDGFVTLQVLLDNQVLTEKTFALGET